VSARKQIVVTRHYKPEPDMCARALELLLKTNVSKKGGVRAAPDDAVKEFDGYDAYKNHNR
jgi:hypothetical protein